MSTYALLTTESSHSQMACAQSVEVLQQTPSCKALAASKVTEGATAHT